MSIVSALGAGVELVVDEEVERVEIDDRVVELAICEGAGPLETVPPPQADSIKMLKAMRNNFDRILFLNRVTHSQ